MGGIDVMYAKDWILSDNVFVGIQGRTRGARGAVFLWHETEDCVVERNVIIDCNTGIALGNSHLKARLRDPDNSAIPVESVSEDIDRQNRGFHPDIGAGEME